MTDFRHLRLNFNNDDIKTKNMNFRNHFIQPTRFLKASMNSMPGSTFSVRYPASFSSHKGCPTKSWYS